VIRSISHEIDIQTQAQTRLKTGNKGPAADQRRESWTQLGTLSVTACSTQTHTGCQVAAQSEMEKTMNRIFYAVFLASVLATTAGAMTADIDTDGDGFASLAELQVIYPDLTDELFQEIDTDGDGLVNDEEMLVAIDAGLIADLGFG